MPARPTGSWRATSHAHQVNAWRLDAVKWRETAHQRQLRMNAVRTMIVKALELLNDPEQNQPADARMHLIDALHFLDTDDNTRKGKPE